MKVKTTENDLRMTPSFALLYDFILCLRQTWTSLMIINEKQLIIDKFAIIHEQLIKTVTG